MSVSSSYSSFAIHSKDLYYSSSPQFESKGSSFELSGLLSLRSERIEWLDFEIGLTYDSETISSDISIDPSSVKKYSLKQITLPFNVNYEFGRALKVGCGIGHYLSINIGESGWDKINGFQSTKKKIHVGFSFEFGVAYCTENDHQLSIYFNQSMDYSKIFSSTYESRLVYSGSVEHSDMIGIQKGIEIKYSIPLQALGNKVAKKQKSE